MSNEEKKKLKQKERNRKYYLENREAMLKKSQRVYKKNAYVVCERAKKWAKKNPLKYRLSTLLTGIKGRCNRKKHLSYKSYGKKGIKCHLTFKDIMFLWNRDNASNLRKPSVDRIDNAGNYSIPNCRFIELSTNIKRRYHTDKSLGLI